MKFQLLLSVLLNIHKPKLSRLQTFGLIGFLDHGTVLNRDEFLVCNDV